jgi:hypothetical protein
VIKLSLVSLAFAFPFSALAAGIDIPRDLADGIKAGEILEKNRESPAPNVLGRSISEKRTSPLRGVLINLRSGGRLAGLLVSKEPRKITIEGRAGMIGIQHSDVESMEFVRNDFQEFKERQAATNPADVKALWDLALWTQAKDLPAYARKTAAHILMVEADHEGARSLLGYEKIGGLWLGREEALRAKGFVEYNGRWLAKDELDWIIKEKEQRHEKYLAEQSRLAQEARARQEEQWRRRQEAIERAEHARREAEYAGELRRQRRRWWGGYHYPFIVRHPCPRTPNCQPVPCPPNPGRGRGGPLNPGGCPRR